MLLVVAAIFMIPLQQKAPGYATLLAGLALLPLADKRYIRHVSLVFLSVGILGSAPIDTRIDFWHFVEMGLPLTLAIAVPYLVMRYVYKETGIIEYPLSKHSFTKSQVGYIVLALIISYLILPFWMQSTDGYMNWTVETNPSSLFVLFLGTNALGIWDELFFIVTVLALMRQHMPFWVANIVQASLFTAFLYELGFRGWAPYLILPFALSQGLVFKYTQNLVYIIAIHLTIDFILYLALINAHHPELINIFITR